MIKPGKMTCAGLVLILMVLPTELWKRTAAGADRRDTSRMPLGTYASRPVGKRGAQSRR
jgi:hypothetical protein